MHHLILLVVFGLLCFSPRLWAKSSVITLAIGSDYAPYIMSKSPDGGCLAQMVQEAFTLEGKASQLRKSNWSNAYQQVEKADRDATFPWAYDEKRAATMLYSLPLYDVPSYAWFRRSQHPVKNLSAFKGKRLCMPKGYGVFGQLEALLNHKMLTRTTPDTMQQCFVMLAEGKVDLISAIEREAESILTKMPQTQKEQITQGLVLSFDTYHLLVGKTRINGKALISLFNRGLKQLQEGDRKQNYDRCGLFAHLERVF